jgi:plasmid maintenance system antidote protein VapI
MMESFRRCEELSQAAMARKLLIPRQHLCDIEKGRRPVSADRAATFARRLGYSEHQFVAVALQDQLRSAGLDMKVKIEVA